MSIQEFEDHLCKTTKRQKTVYRNLEKELGATIALLEQFSSTLDSAEAGKFAQRQLLLPLLFFITVVVIIGRR